MNIQIARPSVASLPLEMRFSGQPLGTATGFIVQHHGQAFLVTNWHVVTGRRPDTGAVMSPTAGVPDEVRILHNQVDALGRWIPKIEAIYDGSGAPRWREHPEHRRGVDVVVLELTQLQGVAVYPHDPWAPDRGIARGVTAPLSIVGFPFGFSGGGGLGIWVQGTVATEPTLDYDGLPRFLIDSRTRQGQSGSPVIAYYNGGMVPMQAGGSAVFSGPIEDFVGVYSGRIDDRSDLGFVWKASVVKEIIERGVPGSVRQRSAT